LSSANDLVLLDNRGIGASTGDGAPFKVAKLAMPWHWSGPFPAPGWPSSPAAVTRSWRSTQTPRPT
jgi:hypothetical protein